MKVIPPIAVSDLNLTASSVPEPHAPGDFNAGTTYGKGAFVTDAATKLAYQSLRDGNSGNTPAVSPLFWAWVGYKEVAWNSGTTYAASSDAAPVYVLAGHRIFESLQGGNTNKAPAANPDFWEDIGPSLQYAMFDIERSTAAVGGSPLVVVLTPGERVDTVAALAVLADSVRVVVTSGGVTKYDQTADLLTRDVYNYYTYFYQPFAQRVAYLFQNLPPYIDAVITVTFARASGNVQCGALVIGRAQDLGITEKNPENDALNFSTIDRDNFGNAVLIKRRAVPKTIQTTALPSSRVGDVLSLRAQLNAVPAVWAGLTNNDSDYFPSLLILGVYKQFKVTLFAPKKARLTLELEEV